MASGDGAGIYNQLEVGLRVVALGVVVQFPK
jgi:hypothetical protein